VSTEAATEYRCPGETQSISRSVHLGRLTRFYAGCLDCPHRHEAETFSVRKNKQLDQWSSRRRDRLAFQDDSIVGGYPQHLGPRQAGKIATAYGSFLRHQPRPAAARPTISIANDGSPSAAVIQASMIEGLRFAGCDVVDVGLITAPVMVRAIADLEYGGGVLIGAATQGAPQVVLRLFGAGGLPLSRNGSLDEIQRQYETGAIRGTRSAGSLRREQVTTRYLDGMRGHFHALRPLRFIMSTPSRLVREYGARLIADVGCTNLAAEEAIDSPANAEPTSLEGNLSERVVAQRADFGIEIDAAGQSCQVVDELGNDVVPHALLRHLVPSVAGRTSSQQPIEPHPQPTDRAQQTFEWLLETDSSAYAAAGGQFWFADPTPAVDGLRLLAHLLILLSRSDRPLSEVLTDALPA